MSLRKLDKSELDYNQLECIQLIAGELILEVSKEIPLFGDEDSFYLCIRAKKLINETPKNAFEEHAKKSCPFILREMEMTASEYDLGDELKILKAFNIFSNKYDYQELINVMEIIEKKYPSEPRDPLWGNSKTPGSIVEMLKMAESKQDKECKLQHVLYKQNNKTLFFKQTMVEELKKDDNNEYKISVDNVFKKNEVQGYKDVDIFLAST